MKPVLNRGHPCTFRRFQINGRHFKSRLETKSWRVADGPKKPCAVLADLKAGWRMLPVEPECDSVMSRQTLIHFFPNQYHTHPDRQGLTKAFCRAHFPSLHPSFPLSSPSLSVSVPAYQTWQYQLAAGKLTARGYKLLWEYLYRRWGGGGGGYLSQEGTHIPVCVCMRGIPDGGRHCERSDSQVRGAHLGRGPEQYLIPIKIAVNTCLKQLCTLLGAWHLLVCLPDSQGIIRKVAYLFSLLQRCAPFCTSQLTAKVWEIYRGV